MQSIRICILNLEGLKFNAECWKLLHRDLEFIFVHSLSYFSPAFYTPSFTSNRRLSLSLALSYPSLIYLYFYFYRIDCFSLFFWTFSFCFWTAIIVLVALLSKHVVTRLRGVAAAIHRLAAHRVRCSSSPFRNIWASEQCGDLGELIVGYLDQKPARQRIQLRPQFQKL